MNERDRGRVALLILMDYVLRTCTCHVDGDLINDVKRHADQLKIPAEETHEFLLELFEAMLTGEFPTPKKQSTVPEAQSEDPSHTLNELSNALDEARGPDRLPPIPKDGYYYSDSQDPVIRLASLLSTMSSLIGHYGGEMMTSAKKETMLRDLKFFEDVLRSGHMKR